MAFIIYVLGVLTGAMGICLCALVQCSGEQSRAEEAVEKAHDAEI